MNYYNKNGWTRYYPTEQLPMVVRYRWKCEDAGFTTYFPGPPISDAFHALVEGLKYGFPTCCIIEFCFDNIDGRHPGARRGKVPDGNGGVYVPCTQCCKEMGREIIYD